MTIRRILAAALFALAVPAAVAVVSAPTAAAQERTTWQQIKYDTWHDALAKCAVNDTCKVASPG